ncbi:MAG: MMPL family transporter [Methanomassiliicoccales archaeon]|nr:MMPL family transporter [Methanomassiliicoccales archaeon]
MVFEKLADVITKHYRKVLIAWLVILVVSVPAILQVNEVVTYESTGVTTGDYESVKASEIISSEFQGTVSNGTIIIVLQADDVTDVASRDYVLTLQDEILSSAELNDFTGMTTVYTINAMVMTQTVMALGPTMRPAEQQVNSTAFLLWGVPALHVSNWVLSYSDSEAYNATSVQLMVYLQQQGADPSQIQLTMGYYNAFAAAWNASGADPLLLADPMARATASVNMVAPAFIASLPVSDEEKQVMTAVLYSFDLTDFNDPMAVHGFTMGMISQATAITNMTFLQEVYDLGPSYTTEAVTAYVNGIISSGTLATYPVRVPTEYLASLVSPNNKTMLITLSFSVSADYVTADGFRPMFENVDVVRSLIREVNAETDNAMTGYVTGDAAISADMMTSSMEDMELIEPFTIIIIIVLMGILFRSVLAQFLPLGAVAVALGISQALVFVIGSTVAQIDSTVLTILFALLMGVGTDYSIFIVTRYREERIKGATREQAVHTSVTWAGESIVTSGATVMIAFFAMALASFSFVQTMGLVMGMAILVALLVSLTLVPAVLMLVGNRIFWPNTGQRWKRYAENIMQRKRTGNHGYFHKAASFAVKHAKLVVVVAIVLSIPATYVYLTTEPSFDFIGAMGETESIAGMEALSEDFGSGRIMPTQVVVTGDTYVYQEDGFNIVYLDAIENLTASVASDTSMVQQVTGPTRPFGTLVDYHNLSAMPEEQRLLLTQSMLQSVGSSNKTVLLTVILKPEPQSNEAVHFISDLRQQVAEVRSSQPALAGSTVLVGGSTASLYDLSTSINEQFGMIEIVVVIGIFLVLMIVLGSLLLPLFAVVSIAMSIAWSFALTYLVFGTWLGEPILFIVPLVLFVMLMGIGMDYNVFILTRIREEVHKGKKQNEAIVDAVDWTGGIITALALIMAGAFGSLMLSSNTMLVMFGFALTVAILIDAMVVRTYIVPAAMALMGKWAWYAPGRLQREGRHEKMKK